MFSFTDRIGSLARTYPAWTAVAGLMTVTPFFYREEIGQHWQYISGAARAALTVYMADKSPAYSFAQVFEETTAKFPDRPALW